MKIDWKIFEPIVEEAFVEVTGVQGEGSHFMNDVQDGAIAGAVPSVRCTNGISNERSFQFQMVFRMGVRGYGA